MKKPFKRPAGYIRGDKYGYYRTIHKHYTMRDGRGMTEGDVREKIGQIKVQVFKWDNSTPIGVRDLKEILGKCGFYMTESSISKISSEGQLKGSRLSNVLYFKKKDLNAWIKYLTERGIKLLIERGVIEQGGIAKNTVKLIGRENESITSKIKNS